MAGPLWNQPLLPAWPDVPEVAARIAHAATVQAVQAVADGVAPNRSSEQLTDRIRRSPDYPAAPA